MKMVFGLLVVGLLLFSGAYISVPVADDGAGLVMSKCGACHSLKRVCRSLGRKDLDAWKKTNKRMADMGMTVSDAELDLISSYLAGAKPGEGPVCQ
ncbi:hypothetical protein [Maridesulfovibrio sp.]|uniref:hypothetical protein n=1 Tax=Maridesulfovibrio sp. TaxID=2795000 RepID=UPI002A189607|nr:hypothetical protein [Maridesulfovibrio sp.]